MQDVASQQRQDRGVSGKLHTAIDVCTSNVIHAVY